jgi:chromosome segregation ATPase
MAEEGLSVPPTKSEDRPQTAVKDRKVPGGFDPANRDDLSPNKDALDNSSLTNKQYEAINRLPSLDHTNLPSLPTGDSSLLYNPSDNGDLGSDALQDSVDERAMQKHLNDVESSFMPVASPIMMDVKKGADDTYLFDGAQPPLRHEERPLHDLVSPTKRTETNDPTEENSLQSPSTPASVYQTPAPNLESSQLGEAEDSIDNTSSLETMSSPTAAAAARTISRALSMVSNGGLDEPEESGDEPSQEHIDHLDNIDVEATPKRPKGGSFAGSSNGSTLQRNLSNRSSNDPAGDAGSTPGFALLNRKGSGKRPKYLRSRYSSQHSSISSLLTNLESQDGSDVTLGAEADYALQSGGAIPAGRFSRSSSTAALSRSLSLGSMASAIDDLSGGPDLARADVTLATLTEEELNRERAGPSDISPPETPRATSTNRPMPAPTDTIIARHVRNVHVPESVAQEYRSKNGNSPKRSVFPGSTVGKSGKNMTLKEQSSTIERLSKENFDLKLKVMFLSERLDKLSEEGVKEMISENVELKTGLAIIQRDNKALRRKVKELEKQLKDDEDRPSTARSETSGGDPSPKWFDQEGAQEREEELIYLRERVEEYVTEIEKLRSDALSRENEKRNLTEVVRQMGERRGQNVEAREEMDVWKDLLEQETARREQSDEDNKRLREEVFRLKSEGTSVTGIPGLNHTTNIYNITKKRNVSPSRPRSRLSDPDERNGTFSAASTLVEELRRESEQLRHENAELRREVGAQTSMLTSRNREKERLYQEIEDLKLGARRGAGSVAGDSIFERSASRAHERSSSHTRASSRQTVMADIEREDFENKHAELRDRINSLKIQNQDLQRELQSCMEDFETAVEQKKEAEGLAGEMQEALEIAENDLLTMQTDRDEALRGQEEAELMFESLRKEAQEELDAFAADADEASAEIERLQTELSDTTENFNALQNEMREMSEALVRLEDDHEQKTKRIQKLEQELDDANRELEQMENNLVETNGKINRLTVQQESSQGEIAFLREEQDGDKIKIGDLEAALRNTEQNLQDEQKQVRELEQRLSNERHQREVVAGQEKEEVQRFVDELNREACTAKDDARKLRKELSSKEVESAEWKQRLMELESNLREALGDLNGTRSSLLNVSNTFPSGLTVLIRQQSIAKLQRELENTIRDLDSTKASLTEKERIIKQRDQLLESHALESRKLADMLDKERQSHRSTKHQYETYQKTQQHSTRQLSQYESRVLELETSRTADKKKITFLENQFKDQMNERNTLLLTVWGRLSALCGTDWAHNNSLINGRALPSLEAVANMLPGFSKNLLAAVKTVETLVGDFRTRIRAVEKDLWKEYQALESNLENRTKRLERLETITRSGIPSMVDNGQAEIAKLRESNRILKTEVSTLRAAADVRAGAYTDQAPSPSVLTGPRSKMSDRSRTSTLSRHQSTSAVETLERAIKSRGGTSSGRAEDKTMGSISPNSRDEDYRPDLRWQVRLQELEYKLKAEREARKLDRSSARQRLEEKDRENAELAAQVQRERSRVRDGS